MTMDGKYVILLLLSAFLRSQAVITANKSFSICNTTGGLPACAFDTPDKRISLSFEFNPAVCPEVLCAWECREDLQCLEFNVHNNNRTCDLYYNQPMNYQYTTDCRHFQREKPIFCQNEDSNPCKNGGSCYPVCHDYICICQPGYHGKNCDISPVYLGCYADGFNMQRDLDVAYDTYDHGSIALCQSFCVSHNSTYFGLQFQQECYCGNSYGRFGKASDSSCMYKCLQAPSDKCGGNNYNSVFTVCPIGYYGANCAIPCDCGTICSFATGSCEMECNVGFYDPGCYNKALTRVNLAFGKPTDQSSTLNGDSYCTSTNDPAGGPNWWMVDLQMIIKIGHVVLTNRDDCCVDSLDYYIVGVTNTSSAIQAPIRGSYPLCGQFPTTAVGGPLPVYCNVSTPPSRYVIIQQPANGTGQLSLCEAEVYYDFNIALGKPANQSSTYINGSTSYYASRAVDGNIGLFSCTNDGPGVPNWLMVDLGQMYSIGYVIVTNRVDCCRNRLDWFVVEVTNTPSVREEYSWCGMYPSAANGIRLWLLCDPPTPPARYVIIQQPTEVTAGYLNIRELEVYSNY